MPSDREAYRGGPRYPAEPKPAGPLQSLVISGLIALALGLFIVGIVESDPRFSAEWGIFALLGTLFLGLAGVLVYDAGIARGRCLEYAEWMRAADPNVWQRAPAPEKVQRSADRSVRVEPSSLHEFLEGDRIRSDAEVIVDEVNAAAGRMRDR